MVPIFAQENIQDIGHSFNIFLKGFIEIHEKHLLNESAKSFAVVLYDFHDQHIREVLKNKGGVAQRDRLPGNSISLFYLTSNDRQMLKSFNDFFLRAFKMTNEYQLPFVLFFDVKDKEVTDTEIVKLEQTDFMFAFKELYDCIDNYKERKTITVSGVKKNSTT